MSRLFGAIPNVVAYQKSVRDQIKRGEDLATPFGRRRRYYLITDSNFEDCYREGLSYRPQSISSDLTLRAFTWSRRELRGKAYIRNVVHDSILAECEKEDAEEVGRLITSNMLRSAEMLVGDYVRFDTDTSIGRSWGDV
jgi:DNA polymerase I-like protein with 3'-5' exonuclease and polymerase domains